MDTTKHPNQPAHLPRMSTPHYQPKVGDEITVEVPDERTRAVIESLVSDTHCIARLLRYPVSKSHNYKKGDLVPCKHETLGMGVAGWRVISQRELDEAVAAHKKSKRKKRNAA